MLTKSLLREWNWKNGVLLLFAPRIENIPYRQQAEVLAAQRATLADRDVVVLNAIGDRAVRLGSGLGETLETARLRRAFGVAPDDFRIVYVGRDGAERFRSPEPVAADRLLQMLDAAEAPRAEAR